MGKHKPIWNPSTDCGDYVVAVGCTDLHTTGKKRFNKKYYSHTTRPGSLKEITMDRMMAKWGGGEVLRRAVRGMLPKNRLRDDRMARLKCAFFPSIHLFPFFLPQYQSQSLRRRADLVQTVFEGMAHPYKQNILTDNTTYPSQIAQQPAVQATFAKAAEKTQ